MKTYRIIFSDGNEIVTGMNATLVEARSYYMGNTFNFGIEDDYLVTAISCEEEIMTVEIRKYACGCVDHHDSSLFSSTCVDHCKDHAWIDGELTPSDSNPAACEGVERNPILVVTGDRWSRDRYVVFEDDQIIGYCIPDDWIDQRYDERGHDDEITREQIASDMEDDFFGENTDVDECWPEHHILRAGSDYYSYTDDGMCSSIDEDDALEQMADVREKRIQEWNDEQQQIASAEIVTPRQAGIIDRFGADDAEKNEMADDTTLLRKHNGRLFVYEAQLGDDVQWRLLQPRPHMPTGTLSRPAGS